MHCSDNGFVLVCVILGFVLVLCENSFEKDKSEIESDNDDDVTPEDLYSFVALIDVVFTEGTKKTCTGTIIHDYVVITAAHCFKITGDNNIQAELTASFVVIGTKKMFDTGYEQYLPIERIIIHPKYSGWTADLALVHTFAGMISDKPGRIVPLATGKTNTPVDSDVTVFSWGEYKINNMPPRVPSKNEKCSEENGDEALDGGISTIGNKKVKSYITLKSSTEDKIDDPIDRFENQKVTSYIPFNSDTEDEVEQSSPTFHEIETSKIPPKQNKRQWLRQKKRKNRKRIKQRRLSTQNQENYKYDRLSSAETRSRYRHRPLRSDNITFFDSEANQISWEKKKGYQNTFYRKEPTTEVNLYSRQSYRITSYYRNNWRRKMGDQHNKLTILIFGFVNMQTCKKLVERAMPSSHGLKNPNEVLCYSSEAHYITEEDSGAPAMRRGRLVAVTVGGTDFDGERVAIGMKITCFCSWISDNIPITDTKLQCCKNCCETKDDTQQNHLQLRIAQDSSGRSKSLKKN